MRTRTHRSLSNRGQISLILTRTSRVINRHRSQSFNLHHPPVLMLWVMHNILRFVIVICVLFLLQQLNFLPDVVCHRYYFFQVVELSVVCECWWSESPGNHFFDDFLIRLAIDLVSDNLAQGFGRQNLVNVAVFSEKRVKRTFYVCDVFKKDFTLCLFKFRFQLQSILQWLISIHLRDRLISFNHSNRFEHDLNNYYKHFWGYHQGVCSKDLTNLHAEAFKKDETVLFRLLELLRVVLSRFWVCWGGFRTGGAFGRHKAYVSH